MPAQSGQEAKAGERRTQQGQCQMAVYRLLCSHWLLCALLAAVLGGLIGALVLAKGACLCTVFQRGQRDCRDLYNYILGGAGAGLAALSLVYASLFRTSETNGANECRRALVLAFWVLIPPLFFWVDWMVFWPRASAKPAAEEVAHTHDLARNIWLALVAILTYLLGLKFDGTG